MITSRYTSITIFLLVLALLNGVPTASHAQFTSPFTDGSGERSSREETAVPVVIKGVDKDAETVVRNTLSNIKSAGLLEQIADDVDFLRYKEETLDGVSKKLGQYANDRMASEVLQYVNGGEDGGTPSFVTDYRGYVQKAKDEAAKEVIYSSVLDQLGPHAFAARVASLNYYVANERGTFAPTYTLDEQCEDADAFKAGNFRAGGGWDCFNALMLGDPANHPITAEIAAKEELMKRVDEAEERALTKANWGDGFLPKEVVRKIPDSSGNTITRRETVTPGAVIRDAVAFQIGERPAQELIAADELDEVLDALSQQITTLSFTNLTGMIGLGGNERFSDNRFGESGNESYLAAVESADPLSDLNINTKRIRDALAEEEEYNDMQTDILDTITDFEERIEVGTTTDATCFDISLPDELATDKENAKANREVSDLLVGVLTEMVAVLDDDTSTGSEKAEVATQFGELMQEELVRTENENTTFRSEYLEGNFTPRANAFESELSEKESECDIESALTS